MDCSGYFIKKLPLEHGNGAFYYAINLTKQLSYHVDPFPTALAHQLFLCVGFSKIKTCHLIYSLCVFLDH